MASSEAVRPVPLGAADAEGGLALSAAAGWNQTVDDWRLFLAQGHGIGVRADGGRLVASAAALPYGGGSGWISMVLVDPGWRHRGIASRLMNECVQHLRRAQRTATLDATPDGEAVYRQLGFEAGFAFERWEGEAAPVDGPGRVRADEPDDAATGIGAARLADVERIAPLDAAALGGVGRTSLLLDFLQRPSTQAWLEGDRAGFVIARAGHRATQVGPLVAARVEAALALLRHALARVAGRVFIDIPVRAAAVTDELARRGFARQRSFVRMTLGSPAPAEPHPTLFAVAGPEFG